MPNESNTDKFNIRLDHKFNNRVSGFVRVGRQKTGAFEAPNIDGPSGSNQNGYIDVLAEQMVAGTTWMLGPTRVLDARLGVSLHEGRQEAAGDRRARACSSSTASPACRRTTRRSPAA